jgi:UDP-N-acetylmuramoyl-tripeptide--D-alanyl-D-alanine ligase
MYALAQKGQPVTSVMKRQNLVVTTKAKALLVLGYGVMTVWPVFTMWWAYAGETLIQSIGKALMGLLMMPLVVLGVYCIVLATAELLYRPRAERLQLAFCREYLQSYKGKVIVIAGSYGKTSMKELLLATLGTEKKVAATIGNGNTPSAHAQFIRTLSGNEEFLLFELGEGKPGDVRMFAEALRPECAIITGLAPNHLDQYKSVDVLAKDLLSLNEFVSRDNLFINGDSQQLLQFAPAQAMKYTSKGGQEWDNREIQVSVQCTSFKFSDSSRTFEISSPLLGRHQVGPLGFAAAFALQLGVSAASVQKALSAFFPHQHRMQPYMLSGATIVDDTYNGNLEGILAGLSFLDEIKAKRTLYVTPGLVDQGEETDNVHIKIAEKISEVQPDWVILMQNSATDIIASQLSYLRYEGKVTFEPEPLQFYQNLDQIVRAGDVVLMQNDWTDNYH